MMLRCLAPVLLSLLPKGDGGYVFTPVCLFVCEQDISKSCRRIRTKLGGRVGYVTRNNLFDFGGDPIPDPDPDPRIFFSDSLSLSGRAKTIYSRKSQKVVDGFR